MLSHGKHRVAYFYETANDSSFRYRAYNMVQTLNETDGLVSAGYFFSDDLDRLNEISEFSDFLVVCRSGYNSKINQLINRFKLLGKKVFFDVDDFVFDTRCAHLIINTLDLDVNDSKIWDYWFAYLGRMGETLRMCDAAITTNTYLASKISAFTGGCPVTVIPNFINREQLNISNSIYEHKLLNNFAIKDKITFGYFSGTPSHNNDFAIIEPVFENLLSQDLRTELVIAGYIKSDVLLNKFKERVRHIPFQDYLNLQRFVGGVEFNLIPLQINEFTQCKSELKFFESAILGTLSIASPTFLHSTVIKHGVNGYISKSHEWDLVIQHAIKNVDHYSNMAIDAYKFAYDNYAWCNQKNKLIELFLN